MTPHTPTPTTYPSIDSLTADGFLGWLMGWIDGEGNFDISRTSSGAYAFRARVEVRDDDAPVLGTIVSRTGLGTIGYRNRLGGSRPQAEWRVTNHADLLRLCEIIDAYEGPRGRKLDEEGPLFAQAVRLRAEARGGRVDWEPIAYLADQLRSAKRYNPVTASPARRETMRRKRARRGLVPNPA